VTLSLAALGIRAVVLDVEGTTTSIDFVYRVLFGYARTHLAEFVRRQGDAGPAQVALAQLREEQAADQARGGKPPAPMLDYVLWLMDQDRKSPGLKALQGLIWEDGYRAGQLSGDVYPDVPPALSRWHDARIAICIYSSGSVLAQKLLFSSTPAGDLTPLIDRHFDTGVGAKREPASYAAISRAIGIAPEEILFVSDVTQELDAARGAGFQTALCIRGDASAPQPHAIIRSFDEISV
jgi:enolase-phosphatase E1